MVKIFIDPGHGGADSGAIGNGMAEKDLVLDISKRIKELSRNYKDVEIRMSREDDQFISLSERANMANSWGADSFLSIHVNASGGEGFESYIWNGNVSSNTVSNQTDIHEAIMKQIGGRDRGKKRANFAVLRETSMPALLTENLFIDHSRDAAKLRDDSFLDKLAQGHLNGIVSIYNIQGHGSGESSGDSVINGSNDGSAPSSRSISSIQSKLNQRYGFSIAVDNIYGPETKSALLKALQIELNDQFNTGLMVDGVWGPNTQNAIVNIRKGASGNITWILQATLLGVGFSPGSVDGIFGKKTEETVRRFQRSAKITEDGIAGQETFTKLFN